MTVDRRKLLTGAAAVAGLTVAGVPTIAAAQRGGPVSAFGLDASEFGVRLGSPDDQSAALQRAIDKAAAARAPLALAPGIYRAGGLQLPAGAQIFGVRGGTQIQLSRGPSLLSAASADDVVLSGLTFNGRGLPLPDRRGLIELEQGKAVRIVDCHIAQAGGIALLLSGIEGEVSGNTITDAAHAALLSYDARGLVVARNIVRGAGNNGIQIWRREAGDDGSLVIDNRIEGIANRSGGSGQYGNAINVFRAGNVIVRGNRIRNCAFTAVRGNAASNLQIANNSVSEVGEVAFYSEFAFEGALIANNTVDGAAIGVSVCNFNEGGRLAIVSGNIIRNLKPNRPAGTDPGDGAGIGIYAEADTAITGNVIENAPGSGIALGWGPYLRDVSATGNVIRKAAIGVTVSVTAGAGIAVISDNVIAGATRGAIVGMDYRKHATGDLTQGGLERYAHIVVSGNRAS